MIIACTVIVLMHRFIGWLIVRHPSVGRFFEGDKILLYTDKHFIRKNMMKALVCEEDVLQGVRKSALTDNLDKIDRIYMERNGEISAIKKPSA